MNMLKRINNYTCGSRQKYHAKAKKETEVFANYFWQMNKYGFKSYTIYVGN